MERADAAVGPWSVHLLEIAPELTDADVAKLQDEDEILGPVKSMSSQGCSPTLDDLRTLPLEGRKLWSMRPTIVLQNQLLARREGDAMPAHSQPIWARNECWRNYAASTTGPACVAPQNLTYSWWYHSLCAASCSLTPMPAHSQPIWARNECWRNYASSTTGPACVAPQNLTYSLHEAGGGNDW